MPGLLMRTCRVRYQRAAPREHLEQQREVPAQAVERMTEGRRRIVLERRNARPRPAGSRPAGRRSSHAQRCARERAGGISTASSVPLMCRRRDARLRCCSR